MRIEISSAAQFLVDLVRLNSSKLTEEQLEIFRNNVTERLQRHYTNHWFPDRPCKGSGYRCIRINGKMDPLIAKAGFAMGLAVSMLRSLFPSELTMWIDPMEVSYRIGENGSICVLYEKEKMKEAKEETSTTAPTEKAIVPIAKTPEKSVPAPSRASPPTTPPHQLRQANSSPSSPSAVTIQHPSSPQQQVHHHQHHQHHFSPSKSVVVSSPLHYSPPMSPVTSHHHNQHQALQLSMFLMKNDHSGLVKCKESLHRGVNGFDTRPMHMDRLFVSS